MNLKVERISMLPSSPIRQFFGLEFIFPEKHGKSYHGILSLWTTFLILLGVYFVIFLTIGSYNWIGTIKFIFLNERRTGLNEFSAAALLFPIGVYWQLDEIFGRKWSYCAQLFNEIVSIKIDAKNSEFDNTKLKYLNATLAIDVFLMRLHTHESFYQLFQDVLNEALVWKGLDPCLFEMRLSLRKIRKHEIEEIISEYQIYLNDHLRILASKQSP